MVYIDFDYTVVAGAGSANLRIALENFVNTATSNVPDYLYTAALVEGTTHVSLSFDPSYYAVYKTPSWEQFDIWFLLQGTASTTTTITVQITNLKVYQKIFDIITGDTLEEMLASVDSKLTANSGSSETTATTVTKFISPSGTPYLLNVDDAGALSTIKFYPSKARFLGNSLLTGSTYGMAASAEDKDYYYRINQFFLSKDETYTATKRSSSIFESNETLDAATSTIETLVSEFAGDEDLVVIQLGDNVNTTAKNAVFADSCLLLCRAVRQKCPNARVVWMAGWYMTTAKYNVIKQAVADAGIEFVNLDGLNYTATQSYIGAIQTRSGISTSITNVSSVVENSATDDSKNITVTFTVSSKEYTVTFNVTSYTLTDTTLTYAGSEYVVVSSGVATHPGDEGFRLIANKFLYTLGYTDSEEYYTE